MFADSFRFSGVRILRFKLLSQVLYGKSYGDIIGRNLLLCEISTLDVVQINRLSLVQSFVSKNAD